MRDHRFRLVGARRWVPALLLAVLAAGAQGCIYVAGFGEDKIEAVTVESSEAWLDFNKVAVIEISGFISTESRGGIFGSFCTSVADVRERLDRAAGDSFVKAVVLRINSPGGEATAADIMREHVLDFKKRSGKPVVASFITVAASGGYYVAVACDKIIACPTSITGSIGVITQFQNVEGLFQKIGVRTVVIKSGARKDIGSPFRTMTDEEKRMMQQINTQLFQRFLQVVREGRPKMPAADLKLLSDGRVVDAQQALKLKMIDRAGYLEDAVAEARRLAGIETSRVIVYRKGQRADATIYSRTRTPAGAPDVASMVREGIQEFAARSSPRLLYLWCPTP